MTWLCANNQKKRAFETCARVARLNGTKSLIEDQLDIVKAAEKNDAGETTTLPKHRTKSITYADLFNSPVLRRHLIAMLAIWYGSNVAYYAFIFFLQKLSGDRHFNFIMGGGIESIAYILAYFILSNFGRRIPMVMYHYTNSIICIAIGLLTFSLTHIDFDDSIFTKGKTQCQ